MKLEIGQEVVRTKGDYVVGRIGEIVAIDNDKHRYQVQWYGETKTWVSENSLELTSIPYEIIRKHGSHPKYQMKSYKFEKVMYNGVEVECINFGAV
jgi:hypothetical protein